jgi:hypothetical protein
LPDGETLSVAAASLDGSNHILVNLGSQAAGAAMPASAATQAAQEQPALTEAGMPETGYAGWLLVGSVLLGLSLLLILFGVRQVFVHNK